MTKFVKPRKQGAAGLARIDDTGSLLQSYHPAAMVPTVRLKANLLKRLNLICPVQSRFQKNPLPVLPKSNLHHSPFRSEEGRWPSSRTLGRDAVDAAASGARWESQGRLQACERSNGALTNDSAADGEVVWS